MEVRCTFCREPVDTDSRLTYQRATGFIEANRESGGPNQLIGRELHQEWACISCISKLRRGINPAQATFDTEGYV